MVFGFRKEQMPLGRAIEDLVRDLTALHVTIDDLAKKAGIAGHPSYGFEREALAYSLGCLAIEASTLKTRDKDRFSAQLTETWARRLQKDEQASEATRFLQARVRGYQNALAGASPWDRGMRLARQFLGQLDAAPENQAPMIGALSGIIAGVIDSAAGFISNIQQDFKLT